MTKKYNEKDIIEILEKNNVILLSNYKNSTTELKMICSCGKHFSKSFKIMKRSGNFKCNDCIKKEQVKKQTMPYEIAKQRVENLGYKLLTTKEEYIKASEKNKLQCPNGHIYEQILLDLFKGHRCKKCASKINGDKSKFKYEDVKKVITDLGFELLSAEYVNNDTPLKVKCKKCNHIFSPTLHNLKNGTGCPNCYSKIRGKSTIIPYEDRVNYVENFNYKILTPKEEYINGENKVKLKCSKGHIYEARLHDFYIGNRCPHCKESKGERKIERFLKENDIRFEKQYIIKRCKFKRYLPFDFYLPDYNLLIEYDGKQHFEISDYFGGYESFIDTKIRDTIKNIYCQNNNIDLLRISYWDYKNIENILADKLKLNKENFQRLELRYS